MAMQRAGHNHARTLVRKKREGLEKKALRENAAGIALTLPEKKKSWTNENTPVA
ncbi:MAG: hypothetical protein Q8P67_22145 [archaeon]|nr:hypothetical protein [archaeon]